MVVPVVVVPVVLPDVPVVVVPVVVVISSERASSVSPLLPKSFALGLGDDNNGPPIEVPINKEDALLNNTTNRSPARQQRSPMHMHPFFLLFFFFFFGSVGRSQFLMFVASIERPCSIGTTFVLLVVVAPTNKFVARSSFNGATRVLISIFCRSS